MHPDGYQSSSLELSGQVGLGQVAEVFVGQRVEFMTYKKRGRRMVSDEFICKVMERLAPLDSVCQLHCESGDVIAYLEDKAIAAGRTAPRDFPPTCPDWTVSLLRGQVLLTPDGAVEQRPGYGRYLPSSGPRPPLAGAGP